MNHNSYREVDDPHTLISDGDIARLVRFGRVAIYLMIKHWLRPSKSTQSTLKTLADGMRRRFIQPYAGDKQEFARSGHIEALIDPERALPHDGLFAPTWGGSREYHERYTKKKVYPILVELLNILIQECMLLNKKITAQKEAENRACLPLKIDEIELEIDRATAENPNTAFVFEEERLDKIAARELQEQLKELAMLTGSKNPF